MRWLVALAVGYVVGASVGSKDFDQITQAVKAIRESEEFDDFTMAVRSHVGNTLRELASRVEPAAERLGDPRDLVDQVRHLVTRD